MCPCVAINLLGFLVFCRDGAHIEYFRGLANPIGVKVGPSMSPDELVALIKKLNATNEAGRITLITRYVVASVQQTDVPSKQRPLSFRFGCGKVKQHLPALVDAVRNAKLSVLWMCDPMHGNTTKTTTGVKTRVFDSVLEELISTFQIHNERGMVTFSMLVRLTLTRAATFYAGTRLGGVHFELTGENVTECVGGPQNLADTDLHLNYTTYCDPRLNYAQSMEVCVSFISTRWLLFALWSHPSHCVHGCRLRFAWLKCSTTNANL